MEDERTNMEDKRIQIEDDSIQEAINEIMRKIISTVPNGMEIIFLQREIRSIEDEIMCIQQEIRNIQMENQRQFIREARSKYEELSEVMGMLEEAMTPVSTLEEAMSKLEEAMSKQEEVQSMQDELYSMQEEADSKRNDIENIILDIGFNLKLKKEQEEMEIKYEITRLRIKFYMTFTKFLQNKYNCEAKKYNIMQQEVRSKQQEVRSKQQEVRSILDLVKRKLQISVTTPFPIKVLCWNIYGNSSKTKARNCLVPAVVRAESPDVLLLQEKTSETIVKLLQKFKNYGVVETTPVPPEKYFIEALILYDQDKYEHLVLHREELFPGGPILRDVIYRIIEGVVPNTTWQLKDDKTQELRNIFYDRMIIVGLKIRDNPKSPIMIFISFHNIYKVDDRYVRESAKLFCDLVLEIQRQTGCVVVAGADLNHQLSTRYCTELGATLMQYEVTERRSEGLKVDYCIVAPASTAEEASAEALNFVDTEESDTLHSLMSNPIPRPNSDEPCNYTDDDYKAALDHDPLVCELTIYVSEDENESGSESETFEDD